MIEIERKFLVSNLDECLRHATKSTRIVQGYLSLDPSRTVRIRKTDTKAFLTIKGKSNSAGDTRFEWEKEISADEATQLFDLCLGQTIEKGETIGDVRDPFGSDILEPITSPQKGIVVGVNTSPLVYEGLPLFKVASFLDYDKAETTIEEWDKQQTDSYIG